MSDQGARARQEALERLRHARLLLDQAAGWIQEIDDVSVLGLESKDSLCQAVDAARDQVEQALEATKGDKWALARVRFDEAWPTVKRIAALLWNFGSSGIG